jgi:hypothetical protein
MKPITRAAWTLGVLALIVGTGAGCGQVSDDAASHDGIATYPFARGQAREGAAALLTGTVTVVDGCVYVTSPAGGRTLPVFPESDVTRHGDGLALRGVVFEPGDEIALGGGQRNDVSGATVPSECVTTSMWTVTPE